MKVERGAALLLLLLLMMGVAVAIFLAAPANSGINNQRDRVTAQALAQAKAALLGYATSVAVDSTGSLVNSARPGDLPCPDLDDDGIAEASCGNGNGTTGQANRLGRLPWRTLGIPDLRDGSGERLWYAISSNFKERFRYNNALNNTTPGTISVRDSAGNPQLTTGAGSGAVAVLFAPGAPLIRPTSIGNATPYSQNRDNAGKNNPINYLDLALGEDNMDFLDSDDTNGFIVGPIVDANGNTVLNDRILTIRQQELTPLMEKRVAGEVANCLSGYGTTNANRYPWMAVMTTQYQGVQNTLTGFLPNPGSPGFDDTVTDSTGAYPMTTAWPGLPCSITGSSGGNVGWFANWASHVSIAIAPNHRPAVSPPANSCGVASYTGATCLTLNSVADRQFIITVNGKILKSAP